MSSYNPFDKDDDDVGDGINPFDVDDEGNNPFDEGIWLYIYYE